MKISLIIAAYNVEQFIEKCIYSCMNHDIGKQEYEIVVVNDGSTDSTYDILNRLQEENSNLNVIHQENKGLGAARNTGIKNAKGEFLWFIDGDDYIETNSFPGIMNKINSEDLDILVLNYDVVNDKYDLMSQQCNACNIENNIVSGSEFYVSNYEKSYSWLYIFRKNLFLQNDVWFKEKINMQDSEILPKILINASKVGLFNMTCYYYVQYKESFTNTNNGQKRYSYFQSILEVERSLKEFQNILHRKDDEMKSGLKKKLTTLERVIFFHLLYYRYDKLWLLKCIELLRQNGHYPLKFKPKGKLLFFYYGLNFSPVLTKKFFDILITLKGD